MTSTNAAALERARQGESGPTWFVTDDQTAGRGRRGSAWSGGKGNLAATLLVWQGVELARAATLGFVAGVALAEALEAVAPALRTRIGADAGDVAAGGRFVLKWPNDLLAEGAKLSGILLETGTGRSGEAVIAIGIGVNIASHPEGLAYPATSLRALGVDCGAAELFLALSDSFVDAYAAWSMPGGLTEIRRRWLARAAGIGATVSARREGRVLRGVFETIDEECRLVLRRDDGGRELVAAGEVHFGAVASAGRRVESEGT